MSFHPSDEDRLPRAFVEAWRADEPEASRVGRAYLRFAARRRPHPREAARILVWVLLGVVIGMGGLYAATRSLQLLDRAPQPLVRRVPRRATTSQPAGRTPFPEAASTSSTPISPVAPPELSSAAPATAAGTSEREQWQRVARGLRGGDFESAHDALDELSRHGEDEQRESAQLVRAQLLLAEGRQAEAVGLLRSLRSSAKSPTVRKASTELLSKIDESRPSRRSFAPPEGTNLP